MSDHVIRVTLWDRAGLRRTDDYTHGYPMVDGNGFLWIYHDDVHENFWACHREWSSYREFVVFS